MVTRSSAGPRKSVDDRSLSFVAGYFFGDDLRAAHGHLSEAIARVITECLLNLLSSVHDERTTENYGFAQWRPAKRQHPARPLIGTKV